ncbi:MAG: hemerythrin domain-containing protein [Bacteroidota bacterium]|nr:hemerythrin domain-containing protein [Bacteroidota bacterium]
MENKPIKRNKNIKKLSKDHHSGLLFCWKIRQGLKNEVAIERIKKYASYFWSNHLAPHFNEEEVILFFPLKDELVQKALDDHKQIKDQLDKLLDESAGDAKNGLVRLANLIDDHIRYEERKLFPHLEKVFSGKQLEEIGKKLNAQPCPLTDDFEDQFWIK